MKVGIITFHFVNNFGGALQSYALQRTIQKECQVSAEIIDYRNQFIRFTDWVRLFPITTNLSEIKSGMATMKERFKRIEKFRTFMVQNRDLSTQYTSLKAIKNNLPNCDKYICGSDQIWNPYLTFGVDGAYFLDFVKESNNRISYAASFGTNRIPSFFARLIKKYLVDMGSISVREKDAVDFVKQLTGKDAIQLIDPVFLLSKEEYNEIVIEPQIHEKYLLLYIMQSDDKMYDYVKKLKERLGLRVVEISRYGIKYPWIDECVVDVGPREFVGLFKNADYICTNSYHGFIFSIIYEKEFCLIPCKRFRTRIANLCELLEIPRTNLEQDELKNLCYDKERVRAVIMSERKKSINYLMKNLI